jgi:hypothetical protein
VVLLQEEIQDQGCGWTILEAGTEKQHGRCRGRERRQVKKYEQEQK